MFGSQGLNQIPVPREIPVKGIPEPDVFTVGAGGWGPDVSERRIMNGERTQPNRLSVEERYLRDPVFHALVSTLRAALQGGNFTPTELREAAILAASIHESETIRPLIMGRLRPLEGWPR